MEETHVESLLQILDHNIEDLHEALAPLLEQTLGNTASKLPLIDKAQLHVLWAYAIESVLFSYLRLNGVNAKDHPVFRELNRVKQYLAKIKATETANARPNSSVDKAAAARFIKHALAKIDSQFRRGITNIQIPLAISIISYQKAGREA